MANKRATWKCKPLTSQSRLDVAQLGCANLVEKVFIIGGIIFVYYNI